MRFSAWTHSLCIIDFFQSSLNNFTSVLNDSSSFSIFLQKCSQSSQVLVRSQGGPGADLALSTCPTSRVTRIAPQLFRVVLLHHLHLPLPLTARFCQCGFPVDSPWPPPRKKRKGCGVEKEGVRVGDRDCLDLSGGKRQSHDERRGP